MKIYYILTQFRSQVMTRNEYYLYTFLCLYFFFVISLTYVTTFFGRRALTKLHIALAINQLKTEHRW